MKRNLLKIASILALGVTSNAFAAPTQGIIGTTSTGTADITLTIPSLVRITGMQDVEITYAANDGDKTSKKQVCVYSNLAADDSTHNTYSVTATGNHDSAGSTGTAFYLSRTGGGTATKGIAYSVTFDDTDSGVASPNGPKPLTAGTAQGGFKGFTNDETDNECTNASYTIGITQAAILAAYQGTYEGTLTLVVAPE